MKIYTITSPAQYDKFSDVSIGDTLEIRDFSSFLTDRDVAVQNRTDKWQLLPYRLLDGTPGKMLYVNARSQKPPVFDGSGLPPEISIPLPKEGRYAVYFGIPLLLKGPVLAGPSAAYGIDAAIGEGIFTNICLEYGLRYGLVMEEANREYFCYYRNIDCNSKVLRLRVPFGAFRSLPCGYVRAALSSIHFVRLDKSSPVSSVYGISPNNGSKKPLIVVVDGFSHYFEFGNSGECIDVRLPECYRDSDVRILMAQIHGPATWKSSITSYYGENVTERGYQGKRTGDKRIGQYFEWAVKNGQDPLSQQAKLCRQYGLEFHFSLRANLFFPQPRGNFKENEYFMNGRWWVENSDARLPGSHKLDYANSKTRAYIKELFSEVMEHYDVDGINLDCTRWPPILDLERHDTALLPELAAELRKLADYYELRKGYHIQLSMTFVEQYHSSLSLEEQKISLEKLLSDGNLDFICIQAYDLKPFCSIAHQYKTPCFGVQDGESPYWQGGWREDPLWRLPDNSLQDDPFAGEEWQDQPNLRCCLSPQEYNLSLDRMYDAGADGILIVNNFYGNLTIRDSGSPDRVKSRVKSGRIYGQEKGQYIFITQD